MTDFDPIAHAQALRDRPQDFVSMVSVAMDAANLRAIRHAPTIEALKKAYSTPAKAAKDAGDTDLLKMLTESKDARKKELAG